jgi:outer membrane biogenesis lipoprotein LolB
VIRARALAAACLLGLAGCATPAPPLPPLAPDDPRPQRFVAEWLQRSALRSAVRGNARLAVDAEGRGGEPVRLRARQTLVLERPARLRIEVQGMLGTTLAVLAVDGGEYALFEAETRRFERGPLEEALLWRVAGLALRPEDVVEAVLGGPAADPGLRVRAAFAADAGGVRVELGDDAGARRMLRFDAEGLLRELEVREPEVAAWRAAYDDYAPVADTAFARRISIDTGSAHAELQLRDVELNPPVSADMFRLDGLSAQAAEGG